MLLISIILSPTFILFEDTGSTESIIFPRFGLYNLYTSMSPSFLGFHINRFFDKHIAIVSFSFYLPSDKLTTAHLPLHAHFLAPESPPPPSRALSSSSFPAGRSTTTSALQVRRD